MLSDLSKMLFLLYQVMLAKNLNVLKGLVNGARGIIKGFDKGSAGLLIYNTLTVLRTNIMTSSLSWIVSSVGRALHWYPEVIGSNPQFFFQALFSLLLK